MSQSRLWSPAVGRLEPYVPGEQPKVLNLVKLNTNESAFAPSPKVAAALSADQIDRLRLYPDPNSSHLKTAIARHFDLQVNQVFVGNGSDEVLAHAFYAFFQQALPLLFPDITYSFYPTYCNLYDIAHERVPLADDFSLNLADYRKPNGGIIFANPNAPTGMLVGLADIRALLEHNRDSVVLVDEAYIDFGGESAVPLVNEFDNLLVVHTTSKSRALAGIRLGYAVGHPDLIEALNRVKNSFNSYPVDRLAELAGVASFEDDEYFRQGCADVIANREFCIDHLTQLGFKVLPSAANFVFARPTFASAEQVFQQLRERAVLVRYFNKPRISDYLRISIGSRADMKTLVSALQDIVAQGAVS